MHLGFIGVLALAMTLLGSVHYYLARRLCQWVRYFAPKFPGWIFPLVLGLLMVSIVLGFARSMLEAAPGIKHFFGTVMACWMGVFIYLFLFFAAADLLLLVAKLLKLIPLQTHQLARFVAGSAAMGLSLITCVYGFHHAAQTKIVRYELPLMEDAQQMHIVLISDVHLGAAGSEARLAEMVEEINALQPDIVCIAGDFFDSDFGAIRNPDKAVKTLQNLQATYGVYASLGNHDAGSTYLQMQDFLRRSNIRLLNDEYVVIDHRLVLVGRLDGSPIGGYGDSTRMPIPEVLKGLDDELPVVVMDHNPANMDEYADEVDLILSGHTHKGQIFPGSLITGRMYTVDHGHYQKDPDSPHVIVTSGFGTWGMPMRVGTDSEILSIRLISK